MRQPDSVQHKPRSFLADSERSVNLPRRDAVLGVGDEPHCRKPLVETERRVLKDGSNLDGELPSRMMGGALPALMIGKETYTGTPACRALNYAIRPALFGQISGAVFEVRKVLDGLLKSADWLVFHVFSVSKNDGLRKSIIAQ